MALCNENTRNAIEQQLEKCMKIVNKYEWLHKTLLHDYFIENHWKSLPTSWQSSLCKLSPTDLANFLNYWEDRDCKRVPSHVILPLELLALKCCVTQYCITRKPISNVYEALKFIFPSHERCYTNPGTLLFLVCSLWAK